MLELDPVTVILTIVNLLVLFLILRKLFWRPISEFLDKRRQMVNDDLDNARRDREEARGLLEEHRRLIAQHKSEGAEIIQTATRQADARKEEIILEAGREAAALAERAKAELALERLRALEELRTEIMDLAVAAAEKMLVRNLSSQDKEAFIDSALKEIENHAN